MFFINRLTNEAEMVPNLTPFAFLRMMQRGFIQVSEDVWQNYVDSHFND